MNEEEFNKQKVEYLKAIEVWDTEIEKYQVQLDTAKSKKSELIREMLPVVKEACGGPSFEHDGFWYLLKTMKKSGVNSITKLDKKPGSWLRKENRNAPQI